jgi:hypothetical protein
VRQFVAAFRYTARRFNRAIGDHFGIRYSRVSRIISNAERERARGKTLYLVLSGFYAHSEWGASSKRSW